MITTSNLGKVRAEVARLMEAMNALEMHPEEFSPAGYYYGSPKTAAVRRASMDVTRALADLRRRGD